MNSPDTENPPKRVQCEPKGIDGSIQVDRERLLPVLLECEQQRGKYNSGTSPAQHSNRLVKHNLVNRPAFQFKIDCLQSQAIHEFPA
jgi:hypothetical protein